MAVAYDKHHKVIGQSDHNFNSRAEARKDLLSKISEDYDSLCREAGIEIQIYANRAYPIH